MVNVTCLIRKRQESTAKCKYDVPMVGDDDADKTGVVIL